MKGAWAALLGAAITGTALTLGILLAPLVAPSVWDARVRTTLQLVGDALICARIAGVMALIAFLIGDAYLFEVWHERHRRNKMVYADKDTYLFPTIPADWQMRVLAPERAQVARAISGGGRPLAATVKAVLAEQLPPPEQLALTAPQTTVRDIVSFNPETEPHCLIVGETGSGKSNATRHIVAALSQRYDCKFIICEPGGVDWGMQATATKDTDIAHTLIDLNAELESRQELLRSANVQHITQLRDGPGYLFVVIEEAEATLDNLKLMDRELAKAALVSMRNLARQGRKPGIGGIFVTQAALSDVFDPHVRRNMGRVLIFRSTQNTAEMFRLEGIRLTGLPTGRAYSVAHGGFVEFPQIAVPQLPMAKISPTSLSPTPMPTEEVLEMAPTQEFTLPSRPIGDPQEDFKRLVWETWLSLPTGPKRNYTAVQGILFPGQNDGGRHWEDIKAAVIEMRRRRGQKDETS